VRRYFGNLVIFSTERPVSMISKRQDLGRGKQEERGDGGRSEKEKSDIAEWVVLGTLPWGGKVN